MIEAGSRSLTIVPLGGCGEVGLNSTLILAGDDALLIDCGVLLGVGGSPGVDRVIPSFRALRAGERRLHGVVITHGHEDHIGALPALLAEVDVPIYGPPLAMALARSRLENTRGEFTQLAGTPELFSVPLGGRFKLGPFAVELTRVTHSIPDSAAVFIETPAGRILHSGDFKLDRDPHDGRTTDVGRLAAFGEAGVDVLLSDSTNAEVPGATRSEREVGLAIDALVGGAPGRVVVACLASHLHRLDGIMGAARRHGRRVALVGRSLQESVRVGLETGHLDIDERLLVREERIPQIPRRELVVITTGSQGEPQAGLARIAEGREPSLALDLGDRVVLSSRTIPGNEIPVRRILNQLARQGLEVITDRMAPVHCSGHASAEEQASLIRVVRPRHFIPIHGDRAMLEAHGRTAIREGLDPSRVLVLEDGESAVLEDGRLLRGPLEEVAWRPLDREGFEIGWDDVRDRGKIGRSGILVSSVALDPQTGRLVVPPAISTFGLRLPAPLVARLAGAVARALDGSVGRTETLEALTRSTIRSLLRRAKLQVPEITAHVLQAGSARPGGE